MILSWQLRLRQRGQQTIDVLLRIEDGDRKPQALLVLDDRCRDARLAQLLLCRGDIGQFERDNRRLVAFRRDRPAAQRRQLFLQTIGELTRVRADVRQPEPLDVLPRRV